MSVREFAEYLGVTDRMVSKWVAASTPIVPRPFNQRSLDIALERSSVLELERFAELLAKSAPAKASEPVVEPVADLKLWPQPVRRESAVLVVRRTLERSDMQQALATRDMAAVYRILGRYGLSQRQIAAATEQSQSEISEILAGRRVMAYDVLVRIAEGLQIPRGSLGLAYSVLGAGSEARGPMRASHPLGSMGGLDQEGWPGASLDQ